jgi:carbon-monoxide dehydrogenase medium subunit
MAVVAARLDRGVVREARIALGGIGGRPVQASGAAAMLVDQSPGVAVIRAAAARAAEDCDPQEDIHAPAEYRRDLVGVMVRRALERAFAA